MKLIRYNGGMVSFRLPEDWKSEFYEDGGAVFYRDDENSGTFRIETTSFKDNSDIVLGTDSGIYVEEGFPLKEEVKYSHEDGQDMLIYFWDVTIPAIENSKRIISFSYSIPAIQENDPVIMEELALIRNTILSAHYSQEKIN